jgi:hypothetical protein
MAWILFLNDIRSSHIEDLEAAAPQNRRKVSELS